MNKIRLVSNLLLYIIYTIFPFLDLRITNKHIDEKINKLKNKNYKINCGSNEYYLFKELTELNEKEIKRKEMIEKKGRSILLIITLSGTLLIGTIQLLYSQYSFDLIFLIFIFGICFLIISVFTILPVVNSIQFNDLDISDLYDIKEINENNNVKLNINRKNYKSYIEELVKSIELNRLYLLKSSNNLSSTVSTIKISFSLILIFLVIATMNKFFPYISLFNYF